MTLALVLAAAPARACPQPTCLPIVVHVPVDAAGAPIASAAWLDDQLATANVHFKPLGIGFDITNRDAVSVAAVRTRGERDALGPQVQGTVIHVFVTGRLDDIDKPGEVIRGVTWRHAGTKFVILSTIAMPRVLAHELGHVFGLPHSTYAVSIMNKTERKLPPVDQRTFADPEIAAMRPKLAALLRDKILVPISAP